jgi:hypothetical protein
VVAIGAVRVDSEMVSIKSENDGWTVGNRVAARKGRGSALLARILFDNDNSADREQRYNGEPMSKHHATNHACLGAHAQSCTFFLSGVSVQVMIGAEQQNLSQQSTRTPQNGTGRDRVNVVGSAV